MFVLILLCTNFRHSEREQKKLRAVTMELSTLLAVSVTNRCSQSRFAASEPREVHDVPVCSRVI